MYIPERTGIPISEVLSQKISIFENWPKFWKLLKFLLNKILFNFWKINFYCWSFSFLNFLCLQILFRRFLVSRIWYNNLFALRRVEESASWSGSVHNIHGNPNFLFVVFFLSPLGLLSCFPARPTKCRIE